MYGQNNKINPIETLSSREKEVMELILLGRLCKEICSQLQIKFSTVSSHQSRVLQKMNVENSIELFKKVEYYFNEAGGSSSRY